jgi:ribonuclease HII
VRIVVRSIEAATLDKERRAGRTLNEIEVRRFREIAGLLAPAKLFLDAADVDAARFGRAVAEGLSCAVVSEHKADATYPVVGAASIIAKVARDAAIEAMARGLERRLGLPLGSGYPSDPLTRAFLQGWHRAFGDWPEGTRTTWATLKELAGSQSHLGDFDGPPSPKA